MSALRRLVLRILNVVRHRDREADLAREIDAHLNELQQDFERRGLSANDARAAARRAFGGGVEQAKEIQRDERSFIWLEDLRRDIGYGARTLARTPAFTVVATVTLALGIGAVTVIYSVLRNVVLDPFPYTRSDRMVNLVLRDASGRNIRGPYFSAQEFLDYQEQASVFEDVVGTSVESMYWVNDAGTERLAVGWMTPNGFSFLGVKPLLGRVFGDADAASGAPPVAVMNHRAWVRLFNADPSVIGRTLVLDGITFCSEQVFDTLGLSLVKGRQLSAADVDNAHHVVVINEALAKKYFRSTEPLGATIRAPRLATLPVPVTEPSFEIVGILRDFANNGPRDPPMPQVWLPFPLRGPTGLGFVMRTSVDPSGVIRPVREQVLAVDRQVALIEPTSLEEWMQRVFFARPRFSLIVLGIFACTGIVLVAFGVYGVLAYTISQQTREIAIRMALGGERGHVVRLVLRLGLQLVCAGLLIGVAASLATNRLLENQLWNISPHDPMTFTAAISAIIAVPILACWVPARRAVRVEPMVALRHE